MHVCASGMKQPFAFGNPISNTAPKTLSGGSMTRYTKSPEALAALSPEEFYVTQRSGTERPGTGKLLHNK